MLGLSVWSIYWKTAKTEERFIPHPSTWLNDQRWQDKPGTVPVGGQPTIVELEDGWRRNTINGELWNPHRGYWEPDPQWLYQQRKMK